MIRLGVFDLDGTLLTSKDRLPDTFYEDLELLRSRNVSVAIASARPAQILFDMFDRDVDLLISGEDGNIFYRGRQLLHVRYISPEMAARIYDITSKQDDIAIVCSGPDAMYLSPEHYNRFFKWEKRFFLPVSPVPVDKNSMICKIHVLCRDGVPAAKKLMSVLQEEIGAIYDVWETGYGWIGITQKDSNKAAAVRFFQDYLGVSSDETAVFGDSSNDIPMFDLTDNSYAMKNAAEDIQQKAKHITEYDNDHNGAMKELIKLT